MRLRLFALLPTALRGFGARGPARLRAGLFAAGLGAALLPGGCRRPSLAADPTVGASQAAPILTIQCLNRRIPVIRYRDVLPGPAQPGATSVDAFQRQMEWLASNGYQPITADQLYAHLTAGADVPEHSVLITFDEPYRGVADSALPILKSFKFPALVFAHSHLVGGADGDGPLVDWDGLKRLAAQDGVTVGARGESVRQDLAALPRQAQAEEIKGAKKALEARLGKPVDYFAYPDGAVDAVSRHLVGLAGFKLGFTEEPGLAEESPGLLALHRYPAAQLDAAIEQAEKVVSNGPAAVVEHDLATGPISLTVGDFEGLKIGFVKGGLPTTVLSHTREGVEDFCRKAGAPAGIDGSFFAMASLYSKSNMMIGPCFTPGTGEFIPDVQLKLLPRLRERPMVMWNGKKIAMFNFQPETLNREEPYRRFMPDFTDLFLGGAWIVHAGVAMTDAQMETFSTHDLNDMRRRAFFGWNSQGQPVIGASLQTCSTERLAEAAAAAGVQEAVLLDSGFSTSLVFDGRIVITGHTSKTLPSRPVPHAILLLGSMDQTDEAAMMASAAEGAKSPEDIEGERREAERRRLARLVAAKMAADAKARAEELAKNPLGGGPAAPPGVAAPETQDPPIIGSPPGSGLGNGVK